LRKVQPLALLCLRIDRLLQPAEKMVQNPVRQVDDPQHPPETLVLHRGQSVSPPLPQALAIGLHCLDPQLVGAFLKDVFRSSSGRRSPMAAESMLQGCR
jgi:hypothetical protein